MVTLPQRKVRYYEAVTRLRDERDQVLAADDFIEAAEAGGLIGRIDHHGDASLRPGAAPPDDPQQGCRRVLQRLGGDAVGARRTFTQCLDFLEANRALAPSLRARVQAGDLPQSRPGREREPRRAGRSAAIASRSTMSATSASSRASWPTAASASSRCRRRCCSTPRRCATTDIHPSDLSDLLGRYGIDLIAERIEGERSVGRPARLRRPVRPGFPVRPRRGRCGRRGHLLPPRPSAGQATGTSMAPAIQHPSPVPQHRRARPAMPRWRAAPSARTKNGAPPSTSLRFVEQLRDLVGDVDVVLSDIWGVVHNGLESLPRGLRGTAHIPPAGRHRHPDHQRAAAGRFRAAPAA